MTLLKPTWLIKDITYLKPQDFKQANIHAILIDVDNTLIAWDKPYDNQGMKEWISTLKQQDMIVIAVSNNVTKHVEQVVKPFGIPFIANAKKPTCIGLKKAMAYSHVSLHSSVMIGDQLFTDVLAGNRLGIRTILVKPLGKKDLLPTRMIRFIERKCLAYVCQKWGLQWQDKL